MNINKLFSYKKILAGILALFLSLSTIFAQAHFSGFSGVAGNIGATEEGDGAQFTADAFLAGQVDLFGVVMLRTGVSLRTSNLFSMDLFEDVPASFRLDELSLTVRFPCCHATRYLSIFAGEHESLGSDMFLRRHFGILPTNSRLSETWVGLTDGAIYPFSDFGASYVLKLQGSHAFGVYFYTNSREDLLRGNVDLRYAAVFPLTTIDFSAGVGFPITIEDDGGASISLNRKIEVHTGLSTVIGNTHTASLFLQFGITKIVLNPEETQSVLKLSDLYFWIEPRFKADFMNFHFTMFNVPESTIHDLFYVYGPLGCNLAVFANNVYAGALNLTVGAHITLSTQSITLDNFNNIDSKDISFRFSPFLETPLFEGTLTSRFTIDFMDFGQMHKTIQFTLGYKTSL
ncbi:MAG: hypothetical protein U0I22_06410 [Treponema sp.]|nr:hypothetical protein [Treponema sp.]